MVQGYEDRNESKIAAQATLQQDLEFITKGLRGQVKASVNTWGEYTSRRSYLPFYYELESYNQITEDYKLFSLNPTSGRAYLDRKSTRLNSSHYCATRMPSSARKTKQ